MRKTVSLALALCMILSMLACFSFAALASSEITIAPYETGMENYQDATQLLICPKIAGNWTDDWGSELMDYTWEISLSKAGESAAQTIRLKPASIYPGNSWGILRFTPCLGEGTNRFVPEKNAAYTVTVKVYNGTSLLYTADGGEQTWTLTDDPIVPDNTEPEGVNASGDGWAIVNNVLTVTKQSVLGGSSSAATAYPWHEYRSSITEVIVAQGVTSIGKLAFDSCTSLEKITFAASVGTYYSDCISRNSALKHVVFNGPAIAIGQGIVYLTNNIETVTLTDQTYEEFKAIATKAAYNFESYGGIRTGFDKARYIINVPFTYTLTDGVLTVSGENGVVGTAESAASDYAWHDSAAQITKVIVSAGIASVGAHAFDGLPILEEVRIEGRLSSIGDHAFANCPQLQRMLFAALPEGFGEGIALGSDAISSVVLYDMSADAFKSALALTPYNLAANGGVATGFDSAHFYSIHLEGVWEGIDDLTQLGALFKRLDVDKNGSVSIADVSVLLDYLSDSAAGWSGTYYNVNNVGGTNISDVTTLLTKLSDGCQHTLAHEDAAEATCTVDGHDAYYLCPSCRKALTECTVIEAPGHTVVNDKPIAPTCGTPGLTAGSHCSVCHEVFAEQTVVPATGNHTLVTSEALAPTCGKNGFTAGRYCTVCGYVVEGHEIIPATGEHTLVTDEAVAATCLRSGLTEGTHCTVCGNIVTAQQIVPAQGHQYSSDRCVYCGKADTALLQGKSALFTGDSLCMASTYDKEHQWWGWAGRINRDYGLSRYTNSGVDGASVSNCRQTNTIIRQINNNKNSTFNYVLLEGGTNDGWDSISVGTMTAGTAASAVPANFDLSTFAGGLENLFYYTRLYFPNAKIGYIFTHKMNSNTGSLRDMSAYLAMAKQICEKWNIPMLNVDESPDFAVKYFAGISTRVPDGIHPSSEGYDLLYPAIARFMAEITLDSDFAIYTAEIETVVDGPEPYAPVPEKDEDPQGWIRWLQKDYGETTPMIEGGSAYTRKYTDDGQQHVASPWEYWGGHFQFDYIFSPSLVDFTENIGTANYLYVWEIWYKDSDVEEDYRYITTAPWSVYAASGIYRIETYDQGMTDMHLDPGKNFNKYDIVIIIYEKSTGEMIGWKKDQIVYSDSTELFMQDALNAGAIGR